jgi:hypothetical protein
MDPSPIIGGIFFITFSDLSNGTFIINKLKFSLISVSNKILDYFVQ